MTALLKGFQLKDYTITKKLGEGGFGITYLAEDKALRKKFAIKEYFPQSWASRDPDDSASLTINSASKSDYNWGLERFVEEAKTLARFKHPAIIEVSRIIEANGTAYMVLAYEDGADFGQWLSRLGRSPRQAELDAIVEPLLSALAQIHRNNILHRDISPDNIYVRKDGTPVLLDFGSAREALGQRTQMVSAIVKTGYSPQEQYTTSGRDQGPWTDIYALGGTLYRAVTGKKPQEALERAIKDELVPASEAATGKYRATFLAGIDHALERHHEHRPQDIAEWREELLLDKLAVLQGSSRSRKNEAPSRVAGGGRMMWAAVLALAIIIGGAGFYFRFMPPAESQRKFQAERSVQEQISSLDQAKDRLEARAVEQDETAWEIAVGTGTVAAFRRYLEAQPEGRHRAESQQKIALLESELKIRLQEELKRRAEAEAEKAKRAQLKSERDALNKRLEALEVQAKKKAQQNIELASRQPEKQAIPAPAPRLDSYTIALVLQNELKRVGCDPGEVDGDWGTQATSALTKFNQYAKLNLHTANPTMEAMEVLKDQKVRVCPVICGPQFNEVGGRCVQKTCRAGQKLDSRGECINIVVQKSNDTVVKLKKSTSPKKIITRQQDKKAYERNTCKQIHGVYSHYCMIGTSP